MLFLLLLLLGSSFAAHAQQGFPFQDESLQYSVNWPSGLSLGEGKLTAKRVDGAGRWQFELMLDASFAGVPITDRFRSVASGFCSVEFEKDSVHGPRKARETMSFDQAAGTAKRTTRDGGSSVLQIHSCAKDALAFLYFTRRELGQGRVPAPGTVFFGGPYQIRLEYTGAQNIPVQGREQVADRVMASLKGPASSTSFEMFFARDAARTPLLVRVPLALGTFSLELVR